MAHFDEQRLAELAAGLRRDDPQLARALETGELGAERGGSAEQHRQSAHRQPADRRRYAWPLLLGALGALSIGIMLGQGLVIAVGLVLAGISGHLFDQTYAEHVRDDDQDAAGYHDGGRTAEGERPSRH